MFLGEIGGGFSVYFYMKRFTAIKEWNKIISKIIHNSKYSKRLTKRNFKGNLKISFLIFMTAFFDFSEFIVSTYYLSKIPKISGSLQIRLGEVLIVVSSLLCWYLLKIQMYKHHIFSLIIIVIGIILLIFSEFLFQEYDLILTVKNLTFAIIFSFLSYIFIVDINLVEKYLIDTHFIHPFLLLAFEGIIGLIFTIIGAYFENPLPALKNVYNNILIYL